MNTNKEIKIIRKHCLYFYCSCFYLFNTGYVIGYFMTRIKLKLKMNVIVKKSYVKIYDSYQFSKNCFDAYFDYIEDHYITDVLKRRTRKSLKKRMGNT